MHGDAVEDDVDVNEFSEEAKGVMPPLPRASWFLEDNAPKHTEMYCRKFRKICNGDHRHEESPFFDCFDWKQEQSDDLQQVDPGARNAPVCQKLGVYRHLPIKAHPYSLLRTSVLVGKSPIGVAFGIFWNGASSA